ncbi:EPS-associated transcriptional regulator, MarR family [Leptospira kmetyi serovar Malaysia str. Bejo-Iso9]|nr:EPS-associated transcriptional regulator, MarR family [Leptospira kmetyi serovar Malaysia str. Bejo-Iso9]
MRSFYESRISNSGIDPAKLCLKFPFDSVFLESPPSFFGVPMDDALRHKLLRILEENPEVNQREISEILGISLGKVNYCLKALMDKGWIKAKNFKNSKNKLAYAYFLTPMGIEEKARITVRYLKVKMQEYEQIRKEIEELKKEVGEE